MMRLTRPEPDHAPAIPEGPTAPAPDAARTIDGWLNVLETMVHLPAARRGDIREELHAHLTERVRDLMVGGLAEPEAVSTAVAELGEAVDLARRLDAAHRRPTWRRIMNLAVIGAGLGAIGVGIIAFPGEQGPQPQNPVPATAYQQLDEPAPNPGLANSLASPLDVEFNETPLPDVVAMLSKALDHPIHVHRRDLEDDPLEGIVTLEARGLPARQVMELILDQVDDDGFLAWHVGENLVELGLRDTFDRRSIVLVVYNIDAIIEELTGGWYALSSEDAVEQIRSILQELVSPDAWHDVGGDLASIHIVGGRMFIQAPRRMHGQIAWILAELPSTAQGDGRTGSSRPVEDPLATAGPRPGSEQ